MPFDPWRHHRRSVRLPGFDYDAPGAYFVTIVARHRECVFGDVVDGAMMLNAYGKTVDAAWHGVTARFPNVTTDARVVMPNHVHGVMFVTERLHGSTGVGAIHELPLRESSRVRRRMVVPMVVGYLKMNTSKHINVIRGTTGVPVWQRNYHERIIRDEQSLNYMRQYIAENPASWETDEENKTTR